MSQPETVQYFQFDKEGNMFIYPAGAGINGIPKLVRPGDEMIFSTGETDSQVSLEVVSQNIENVFNDTQISQGFSQCSYNTPLEDQEMEHLSHKDFSKETKKKMKWC